MTDSALELLFRVCRGIPRIASRLLRAIYRDSLDRDLRAQRAHHRISF